MVAHDREHITLQKGLHHFFGLRPITDIITQRYNVIYPQLLNICKNSLQCAVVSMNISNDSNTHCNLYRSRGSDDNW